VRHLLSKIVAGGLSAGVILLWWPLVFPSDSVESWLMRGIAWTLTFELLLHAFAPLEEALWRTRAVRAIAGRGHAAATRLVAGSPRKRLHGRGLVAAFALSVPLALLASAPAHRLTTKPAAQIRQVTEVKRVVRVERRRVLVPRVAAPASTGAASSPMVEEYTPAAHTTSPSGRPAVRSGGRSVVAPRRSAATGTRGSTTRRSPSSPVNSGTGTTRPGEGTSGAPAVGSDERSATTSVGQPKRLA
jgi:hypothetical protein